MRKTKPILFWDFDGVIFDSGARVYQMWYEVMMKKGVHLSMEDFRKVFDGNSWQAFQDIGAEEKDKELYSKMERNRFNAFTSGEAFLLFPFMDEVIKELAKSYFHYIISNNQKVVIEDFLDHHDLRNNFQLISGREDWRPKQEKMIECMQEVEQSPDQTWFVTDSVGDVREGKNIEINTLAVTWGYHDYDRLKQSGATKVVLWPKEILEFLK